MYRVFARRGIPPPPQKKMEGDSRRFVLRGLTSFSGREKKTRKGVRFCCQRFTFIGVHTRESWRAEDWLFFCFFFVFTEFRTGTPFVQVTETETAGRFGFEFFFLVFSRRSQPVAASRSLSRSDEMKRNECVRFFPKRGRTTTQPTNKKQDGDSPNRQTLTREKSKKKKKRRAAIVDRVDRLGRTKNLSLHLKMSPLFFVCVWSTFEKGNPANFPYPEGINFLRFLRFSANPQI